MSKYEPLGEYLKNQGKDLVTMTFAEIEKSNPDEIASLVSLSRVVEQQRL